MINIRSSSLPEENGYKFRLFVNDDEDITELGVAFEEGSDVPTWNHFYR